MKFGLWLCIIAAVGVAHLALIFIVDHWRKVGQPYVPPPEPTFTKATYRYVNEQGTEMKRVKEFTVSTKFAEPDTAKAPEPKPTK